MSTRKIIYNTNICELITHCGVREEKIRKKFLQFILKILEKKGDSEIIDDIGKKKTVMQRKKQHPSAKTNCKSLCAALFIRYS